MVNNCPILKTININSKIFIKLVLDNENLKKLKIKSKKLKQLPVLPDSLKNIILNCPLLKAIPNIPLNLNFLDCSGCSNLIDLPELNENIIFKCDECKPEIMEKYI